MAYVAVRGYRIGEGRPKVILPIIEPTEAQILSRGAEFSTLRADCVEWRLDHWAEPIHSTALLRCLQGLRQVIGSKLLLVTFRSQAEGGEQSCSLEEYSALCRQVCASGCADLLDLELRPTGDALPALIQHAHAAGVKVICSSHDFTGTPPQEELTARMEQMRSARRRYRQAGCDAPPPGRCAGTADRHRPDASGSPRAASGHHEHGRFGGCEPPVGRGYGFCHDVCFHREVQRPRSTGTGSGKPGVGRSAACRS